MTIQQEILPPESQDIIELVFENPALAIRDEEKAQAFLVKVREHAMSIGEKDMSKAKDRDEVRSMASKVTKSKTMLNSARLEMTAGLRKEVEEINAAGKVLTAGLAEIADEVRAPLTAWEEAEKKREELVETTIAQIKAAALVTISDTAASVSARGNEIYEIEIDPEVFKKRTDEATEAQSATIKALHEAMNVLREREEAQAELAKMKAAEAERLAKEAEELRQREAAEAAARAEQEAKEREERLKQEAADKARRDAEEKAEQERLAAEREAQRQIDEANERAAAAQAERDRIAAEKAEEQRIADAQAAEQARRERSRTHRMQVMGRIKADIIKASALKDLDGKPVEGTEISDENAVEIVRALVKGRIGISDLDGRVHVSVQF